jgi:hypothetical protein
MRAALRQPLGDGHKAAGKITRKDESKFARLTLERYNGWQQNRSQIRRWLVTQIAERATEIFRSRRKPT